MTIHNAPSRLGSLILASLLPLSVMAAGDKTQAEFDSGYQAGYHAAIEAAKKALAEGRAIDEIVPASATKTTQIKTDAAPAAAIGVGPVTLPPAVTSANPNNEPQDWWNHSSLFYSKLSDEWRHSLQVDLSGTSLSGNDEGNAWRGGGKFYSRSGRFTNQVSATIDKRSIRSANGALNYRDYRLFQESLRYDLSDRWYVSGGAIFERDDVAMVDLRTTLLAGPGYYWLDNETFRLNTFLGLGRVDEKYMAYVRDHVGVESRDSGLFYLYETFEWRFAKDWNLRQGFRLMQDLDTSGHYVLDPLTSTPPSASNPQGFERYIADEWVKRYRTISAIDFDYSLSPRSIISFGFETRYDSNPWPDVIRRDKVQRVTLRLTF